MGEGVPLGTFSGDVQLGFPNPNPISDRDIFSGTLFQAWPLEFIPIDLVSRIHTCFSD